MKKYFYTDGRNNYGPFTIDELKEKGISQETMVWFQELDEWKPAGEIPELAEIFNVSSINIKVSSTLSETENLKTQRPPKNWLAESILVTLFCCLPFGILGIINAAKVESRFYAGDIDGANQASSKAKKWTMWGFWLGAIFIVIYLISILVIVESERGFY